ncbi:MAG: T9SS type A sorting domain-containing protein, partial [Bacteroidota bacterium]
LSINGFKMIDWTDIETAVEMLKPGENIAVEYRRNGQTMKGSKPIKSYAETKKCENCDCGGNVIALGTTPEFKFRIEPPFRSGSSGGESKPRMDVSSAKVEMAEVGAEDAGELRAKGVDVSAASLAVEGLKLSPNPSNGMFKLEFNLPSNGNTVVRVFNDSGRAIYEYELGEFSGKFNDDVDISQNGAGSYFLHISQNGKVFTKKIQLSGK